MLTAESKPNGQETLLRQLQNLYGDRLRLVRLFGSFARGEGSEQSDLDFLVVLDGLISPGDEIARSVADVTDINLEFGVLVALAPISSEDCATQDSPSLRNIRHNGVTAFSI